MAEKGKVPTRGAVWRRFREIDMTPYHQDINGFTYVPWSRAWSIAMNEFGDYLEVHWHGGKDSNGVTRDITLYPGGTGSVTCSASFDGEKYGEMTLAVMDYRNKAIVEPDSVEIQNARQRCLTKLLASLGLGLYLWENDGVFPEEATPKAAPKKKAPAKKKAAPKKAAPKEKDLIEVLEDLDDKETIADLIPQLTAKTNELVDAGWEPSNEVKSQIKSAIKTKDTDAVNKLITMLDDVSPMALALHGEDANV